MTKNNHTQSSELSYFRLSLFSYLRDSHPDRAADHSFVALRGDAAAEEYSSAIKLGNTHDQAEEIASEILYAGLHFSPYRTIVNILFDEFAEDTDPAQAEGLALELLPRLAAIFEKYTLSGDFADTRAYQLLYTELTGAIQILIEDGSL
jgi:predicted TPR repeat methyltransferase